MPQNKIEKIKYAIASKINRIRDDHAKIITLLPNYLKNEMLGNLEALVKEKIELLEELLKEVQKIEKE